VFLFSASYTVRYDLRPGDLSAVLSLHGHLYAQEYGFDYRFEGYVAEGLGRFAASYTPDRERLWIVENTEGQIVGSVALVSGSNSTEQAQLRWYLLAPAARGQGLGRHLLNEAITFAHDVGYDSVYLWTFGDLHAAIHLYRSLGFVKTHDQGNTDWSEREILEQRYLLNLRTNTTHAPEKEL
jgi:GNAT superfamily N-acetyltransferase